MSRAALSWLGALTALLVLGADQASKYWVVNILRLPEAQHPLPMLPGVDFVWVENRGITFGLFSGDSRAASLLLAVIALAVVVALAVWLRRARSPLVAAALGAIAGGAVGNVLDRLRFGWVADFIHAHAGMLDWKYIFNVADAAIVCGVVALVLDSLRGRHGNNLAGDPGHR